MRFKAALLCLTQVRALSGGNAGPATAQLATLIRDGIDPKEVARRVMRAIQDNDLYIFTHPEMRAPLEDRFRQIIAAIEKAARV